MKKALLLIAALGMTTGMWGQMQYQTDPPMKIPPDCSKEHPCTFANVAPPSTTGACHLDPKVAGLFHCDPDFEIHGNLCSSPDCSMPAPEGQGGLAALAAEPMDVPAVKEPTGHVLLTMPPQDVTKWTCSDKRRILLTAENGDRHCILFPRTEQAELPSERKIFQADGRPPRCPNDPSCRPPSVNPKACCPGQ